MELYGEYGRNGEWVEGRGRKKKKRNEEDDKFLQNNSSQKVCCCSIKKQKISFFFFASSLQINLFFFSVFHFSRTIQNTVKMNFESFFSFVFLLLFIFC